MSQVAWLIDGIRFARRYNQDLLAHVDESDWFRMPAEGVTHIGWQVGHLAIAQYRLTLERVRGARPEDAGLISQEFLSRFGRDSVPEPGPASYPPVAEIRAVLDRVHRQSLAELESLPDSVLAEPIVVQHRLCRTKGEIIAWCGQHEMIHAGQIGLLRRLLGRPPVW